MVSLGHLLLAQSDEQPAGEEGQLVHSLESRREKSGEASGGTNGDSPSGGRKTDIQAGESSLVFAGDPGLLLPVL